MLPTPQLHRITSQNSQTLIIEDWNPSKILKYPNLSKLEISHPATESLALFSKLCKSLKTLKSLKALHLDLSGQVFSEKNIKDLSCVVMRLHNLTSFSLNLKHNYGINGEVLVDFFQILKKKRSLQNLRIDLSGCGKITYEHLAAIYTSISEMRPLKSFYFNHYEISIQCEGLEEFAKSLERLKKLRFLEDILVKFKTLRMENDKEIAAFSHSLCRMRKLSKVSLDFANFPELKPAGFKTLIHSLKSCPKLKILCLNFPQFSSNNFPVQNLFDLVSEGISNSPHLTSLLLDFSYNQRATSPQVQKMLLALQTLPNLSTLDLNFSFCPNLDNETLEFLAKGITNLENLTSLKLNFFQCSMMNGQGLIKLSEILKNLTSLQALELAFTSNQIRSGFPSLFKALSCLKDVSQLSLRFCDSQDIQDEDLFCLAKTLTSLINLKSLDLSFRFCILITDLGLTALAAHFSSLCGLKRLSLNFFGCRKITFEGVECLKSHVARLKLADAHLDFSKNLCKANFVDHQCQQEFSRQSTCSMF